MLAIVSMTATVAYSVSSGGALSDDIALKITPAAIAVIVLMMIPTASLFSAILMSISLGFALATLSSDIVQSFAFTRWIGDGP